MRKLLLTGAAALALAGCTRYEPVTDFSPAPAAERQSPSDTPIQTEAGAQLQAETGMQAQAEQYASLVRSLYASMEDVFEEVSRPEPVKVKAIYVTGYAAGVPAMMEEYIRQIDETELNAVVIDFKNDEGRITCPVATGVMGEIGAGTGLVEDMAGLIAGLKEHGIYTIARVVTFKDPYLAEKKPEWCLKTKDGSVYRDKKGDAWINPYNKEVWEYLSEVVGEACRLGFDEVQFDYIRFNTDSTMKNVDFEQAGTEGKSKTEIVTEFTRFIRERFERTGMFLSADVFGAIIGSPVDAQSVGQSYGEIAANMDYICPMIYPSHYGDGNFGLDHPDLHPYETVMGALTQSKEELALYPEEPQAIVRPWLQDFTASYLRHYMHYGPGELRAQIDAVYDAGYEEWILWNASCNYSWEGLLKEEENGQNTEGGGILPPL